MPWRASHKGRVLTGLRRDRLLGRKSGSTVGAQAGWVFSHAK